MFHAAATFRPVVNLQGRASTSTPTSSAITRSTPVYSVLPGASARSSVVALCEGAVAGKFTEVSHGGVACPGVAGAAGAAAALCWGGSAATRCILR